MGIHIVIDGYNLIRQSRQFSALDLQDMQAGREALISALAAYKRAKPYSITVVFDAQFALPGMPRRDRLKGIEMRYSRSGELADAVIKRMVARYREKMLVVTSDNEIINYAESMGAATIGSPDFEQKLIMAQYMDMKGSHESDENTGWRPTTKKKGPSRRLPKRQRKMKKKLSRL